MPPTDIIDSLEKVFEFRLLKLGDNYITVSGLLELLVLLALVLAAEWVLRRHIIRRALQRTRLDASLQFAVARIFGYGFIALGFYIALQVVGVNLTSLAVVAGAVGVGLGFGLQNIIHNFVSGLIILAERPIAIGDRIEVAASRDRSVKSGCAAPQSSPMTTLPTLFPIRTSSRTQ